MRRRGLVLAVHPLLLVLPGCLYAPANPQERRTGADLVGDNGSGRPIEVGVATRAEAIARLGAPQQASQDGHALTYVYRPLLGRRGFVGLGGPCGLCGYYPWQVRGIERLQLYFDENELLVDVETSRR